MSQNDYEAPSVIILSERPPLGLLDALIDLLEHSDGESSVLVIQQSSDVPTDENEGYEIAPLAAAVGRAVITKVAPQVAGKIVDGAARVIKDHYKDNLTARRSYDRQATDYLKGLRNYVYGK